MMKLLASTAVLLLSLSLQAHAADAKEEKTVSGIGITMLKEGTGASPKASDTVKVHYRGTLENGQEFDSSHKRGQPATFPLSRVIPCWTEGVQKIKVGGKARLVCPPNLAYGSRDIPGIPANSTLIFEVELLGIENTAAKGPAAKAEPKAAEPKAEAVAEAPDSKYGEGSYVGENPPAGFDIKGNEDSMKFHVPESPWYDRTIAEVWFNSEEAAEKAGFVNAVKADDEKAEETTEA